jgi:energy-coupling factor transporter ATP-binding protein EcfA2
MTLIKKENAKEYLKEFATSQDDWLKTLIFDAIETNGDILKERKEEIFDNLSTLSKLNINVPNLIQTNSETEIYISKLVHKNGVNALKENQTIKFNKDITILYGMNGAGKSSYFKILNEIVGGNQKKIILPNIYSNTHSKIDVELSFNEIGETCQDISWDGSNRSLSLLNRSKVFDTSYLKGLLETRTTDKTLVQPLGLNLFVYLVDLIDKFKGKLLGKANKIRLTKPVIGKKYFSDLKKNIFNGHNLDKNQKSEIEKLYNFSNADASKLTTIKADLKLLKQVNIQDKIKLENIKKNDFKNIINYLDKLYNKLSNHIKTAEELLIECAAKETANTKAKEQFTILTNIPSNDTKEWKDFIKAGEYYSEKITDSIEYCAYCRQPLKDEKAIDLVKAYGLFLKDDSEQELSNAIKNINSNKEEIKIIPTVLNIAENIELLLKDYIVDKKSGETLFQAIQEINNGLTLKKKQLIRKLEKRNAAATVELPKIDAVKIKLNSIIIKIQLEIDKLTGDDSKKNEKIEKLEEIQNKLFENESISNQKDKIENWFILHQKESALRKKEYKISTRQISDLSKKAHNELLTESLKQNFSNELKKLGSENLNVKIENTGIRKGIASTRLILTKSNEIKAVLSEGEQKAVALALFIAESQIQKSNNPIILDDPVNSLDHKIAEKLAVRLLELKNQIILFTHNKLFLDAFETSKSNHICKTIDTDCNKNKGKHIWIYKVNSEGKNLKGVLAAYKVNRAKNHLSEAKNLLGKSPFEEEIKVAILIRKSVECTIDEVVFNHQIPTKYSNKNNRIAWAELKKIKSNSDLIKKLEKIHGRVSGGGMHNGTENEENPIEKEEFDTMVSYIENQLKENKKLNAHQV